MRTHSAVPFAFLLATCACAPSERALQDDEKHAIATAVDSAMHAYLDAVAARDADRVIAHYANDPEFLAFFDATPYDYAAMVGTTRSVFGGLSGIDLEPVVVQVTVLGRDAAIAGFTFREAFTDTAQRVTLLRGTASWTWLRRGNRWMIIHGDAVHLPDTPSTSP